MRGSGCQEARGQAVSFLISTPGTGSRSRESLCPYKRPCFVPSAAGLWLSRFCRAVSPLGCAAGADS